MIFIEHKCHWMKQYSTNMLTHGWQCRWRQWESWEGGRAANWWGHLILALGFFNIWTHLLAMSLPVICPILTDSETRNYVCLGYIFNPHYMVIYHMVTVSIYLGILKCVYSRQIKFNIFLMHNCKASWKENFPIMMLPYRRTGDVQFKNRKCITNMFCSL